MKFFTEDHNPLILLSAGNLTLEVFHKWAEYIQSTTAVLVSLGQVAVAVTTVVYLIRKNHLLQKTRSHKKKKPPYEK